MYFGWYIKIKNKKMMPTSIYEASYTYEEIHTHINKHAHTTIILTYHSAAAATAAAAKRRKNGLWKHFSPAANYALFLENGLLYSIFRTPQKKCSVPLTELLYTVVYSSIQNNWVEQFAWYFVCFLVFLREDNYNYSIHRWKKKKMIGTSYKYSVLLYYYMI